MEEISLRELIDSLLKHKIMIIGITLLAIVASALLSFLVLKPVYEAKTTLMAATINLDIVGADTSEVEKLLNKMGQAPQMSIDAYKEQINAPNTLQATIKELGLDKLGIDRIKLQKMVTVGTIANTNLLFITIKYKEKQIAADIANSLAKQFITTVSENAKEQANKSSVYLKQQMEIEKTSLDDTRLEYKDYLSQPKGKNELESEIAVKISLVTQFKSNLISAGVDETAMKAAIAAGEKELGSTPEKITLRRALVDDAYLAGLAKDKLGNGVSTANMQIESEEINEAHSMLQQEIDKLRLTLADTQSKRENYTKQISSTQVELEGLQVNLAEKQYQETTVLQKMTFAQSTYEAFLKKYEETRIVKSTDIGQSAIIVISPAIEPLLPVGPRKMFNIAVAAMLGLMVSVFLAFFMEYWKNSGLPKTQKGVGVE